MADFDVDQNGFVLVYTDGACSYNGTPMAKAGIGVWWGDDNPLNVSEPISGRKHTNQAAEIQAALRAVQIAKKYNVRKLAINTDSQYVKNCMGNWLPTWKENGWLNHNRRPVSNQQAIRELDNEINSGDIWVKFRYVQAHAGNYGNEQADYLAREATEY